jgi:short subunit fatty acids transporter
MPEPFSLGILLTFVALMLAWTSTSATAEDVLVAWGGV